MDKSAEVHRMDDLSESASDRRMRWMEEQIKAHGDRIKLLEGTVGAAASDKRKDKCPPWLWADGTVAEFPRSADGMVRSPAESHDASPNQVPNLRMTDSPVKDEESLLATETIDASPRKLPPPPCPAPRADTKPVKVPPSPTQTADATSAKKVNFLAAYTCPPFFTPRMGSNAKKKAKRSRNKKNKKRKKKAKEKHDSKISTLVKTTALLVLASIIVGQGIAMVTKGETSQAMTVIEEGLKAIFDPAMAKSVGGKDRSKDTAVGPTEQTRPSLWKMKEGRTNVSPPRRMQEACNFCPDGLAVQPDSLIPGSGSFTCGQVLAAAPTLTGALCAQAQGAQAFCCPAGATPDSADPLVPITSPSSAATTPATSLMSSLSQSCSLPDNQVCGCEAVGQSDYRGMINVSEEDGSECAPWNADFIPSIIGFSPPDIFTNSGLDANYCRNPNNLRERAACFSSVVSQNGDYEHYCDVPYCDPCSCMPACGQPNLASCGCPSVRQAESCCMDADDERHCKCGYLKEACQKSLENNSTEFCALAQDTCCEGNGNPWCGCNLYQQICTESPFKFICNFAAESCCNDNFPGADSYVAKSENAGYASTEDGRYESVVVNPECNCQFFEYVTNELDYGRIDSKIVDDMCDSAEHNHEPPVGGARYNERRHLQGLYMNLHGDYWFRNDGWADAASQYGKGEWQIGNEYCTWYGLTCNDDGFISEINLSDNNCTGTNIWSDVGFSYPNLVRLDLSHNNLSGELVMQTPSSCVCNNSFPVVILITIILFQVHFQGCDLL